MDGNRTAPLTLVALFGVSVLLTACSSGQSEAGNGVVGLESSSTSVTSRIAIGEGQDHDSPPESSSDESLLVSTTEPGKDGVEGNESLGGVGEENGAATTVMNSEKDATTSTAITSDNEALVHQDDLVACAKVERGYLLLLDGEAVQAIPVLEEGANHSVNSTNQSYSVAADALSAAVLSDALGDDEVRSSADAFLAVCASDGFERLA